MFTNYCLICFIKLNEIIQKRSIATIKNNHDRLVFIRPKHSKGTSYFYITEIYTISYDIHKITVIKMRLLGVIALNAAQATDWSEWTDWSSCVNGVYNRLRRCYSPTGNDGRLSRMTNESCTGAHQEYRNSSTKNDKILREILYNIIKILRPSNSMPRRYRHRL